MPDEPGALHRAAALYHHYAANINKLQYDRRIDPATVFFEVTADEKYFYIIVHEPARTGNFRIPLKHKWWVQGLFTVIIVQGEFEKIFQSENL